MIRHAFERVAHEERGVVMVIFATFIPVFILIAAFVIEIADGMEHRRQLQLQADAGALAADRSSWAAASDRRSREHEDQGGGGGVRHRKEHAVPWHRRGGTPRLRSQ